MLTLHYPDGLNERLSRHLLPTGAIREEAAFLFVRPDEASANYRVIATTFLSPSDFAHQQSDYLELDDEVRAALIKRAHDLDASLVEIHSHPGPYPAAFSYADLRGLQDTVPYMWWRLKKRPYFAIVLADETFDAMAWVMAPTAPEPLAIVADGRLLEPTNITLRGLK